MDNSLDTARSEVVILGGGLAGLSLALHCRQKCEKARITVLEKNSHPVPEAAFKVGESTVEVGSHYFAQVLGLEEHIREHQLPKLGLRFFFGAEGNKAVERRLELGGKRFAPAPSYQLDRGRFENFLAERCLSQDIALIDEATVKEIQLGRGSRAPHRVQYERNGKSQAIESRWVADASGRAGLLKRKLGLEKPATHFANATWFRVQARIKVDDWCDDPAWRGDYVGDTSRWYSTNHLMGEGYWVWLIPLASGSTSVGIVADEKIHPLSTYNSLEKSLQWLQQYEPQCFDKVQEHRDKIQDFLAIKRYTLECTQAFSARRWGLTGESGFFLDPFYSPGSDFIAFSNTFLSDLIHRDLSGKGIRFRSFLYDRILKRFFYGQASVYQDQYHLFGNQQIMPVKVAWDYMIYWSLSGFIFMHGRLCDQFMYPRNLSKILKMNRMNHFLQEFFREWHRQQPGREVQGLVETSVMPLVFEVNSRLVEDLDNRTFNRRMTENVAQLETLFWEIIDAAGISMHVPFRRRQHRGVRQHSFQHIFDVTNPSESTQTSQDEVPLTA